MANTAHPAHASEGETRRDFLYLMAGATAAVGTVAVAWPLVDSMNPSADVVALATIEVDLAPIELGQRVTVVWQGKPVFIDHRNDDQISAARDVDLAELPDPETDEARVQRAEWLIMVGVCTHLGCIPKGQKAGDPAGEYGGWLCVCHGSQYDTSGRIRKGPAPENLPIPPYEFLEDTKIRIG
ncbi:MAG: ubiquinol-cytochrome c reductase iron-sulfur subunit [Rhodospirillales bacterium]|nr:ubiquinol-cytochrome c reductase iron-sulfur subunit [Rhodospirillales bacterium]